MLTAPRILPNGATLTVLISIFASDILPVFIIASVGFLLARWLGASVTTLAHVSFYALAPCLVFNMLVTSTVTGPQVGRMVLLAVLVTGVMGLLAWLPFRFALAVLS